MYPTLMGGEGEDFMHPPAYLRTNTYGDIHPSCTGLALVFARPEIVIFLLSHCPHKCCIVPDKWQRGSNFVWGVNNSSATEMFFRRTTGGRNWYREIQQRHLGWWLCSIMKHRQEWMSDLVNYPARCRWFDPDVREFLQRSCRIISL